MEDGMNGAIKSATVSDLNARAGTDGRAQIDPAGAEAGRGHGEGGRPVTAWGEETPISSGSIGSIPDGVLQGPTVGQVALALNMSSATVKGWLDSGALPSWRPDSRSWRRVRLVDLALFAERSGLPVNWAVLL